MRVRVRFFACFGLFLALAASAPVRAERLAVKSYGPADGLPATFIQQVTRDSRGFVWFATRDGLSRFDGVRFITYGVEQGLPNPTVNYLLEARDGSYWIATNGGGVVRMDPATPWTSGSDAGASAASAASDATDAAAATAPLFRIYSMGEDQFANRVNALFEDRHGRIWAGTDAGVLRLDRDTEPHAAGGTSSDASAQFKPIPLDYHAPLATAGGAGVHSIAEGPDGTLWFGMGWGLYRYSPDGRRAHFTIQPTIRGDNTYDLLFDHDGRLWLGHQTGLIILQPPNDTAGTRSGPVPSRPLISQQHQHQPALPFDTPMQLPTREGEHAWYGVSIRGFTPGVTAFATFPDGHIWFGSSGGLVEFDGQRFRLYTTAEGLSDQVVTSLAADEDDNLWVATMAGGAMKLTRRGFRSYDDRDGLGDARVHAVFEDSTGAIVAVSGNWFLSRFDGRRFTSAQPQVKSDQQYTWNSQVGYLDRHDTWWLLTNAAILQLPPGTQPETLAGRRALREFPLSAGQLYEDKQGDVWMALRADGAIACWQRKTGTLRTFTEADGFPRVSPGVIAEDKAGHVWIGTRTGDLVRYANGRFTRYPPREPAGTTGAAITALHLDDAGRLWAGSNRDGLIRIEAAESDTPRFVYFTRSSGLGSNNVRSLISDAHHRIYAGTARGVDRLDPDTGRIQHYSTVDGVPSGFVSAAYRDSRGDLWFATMRGLARLQPIAQDRHISPSVLIGGLSIAGTLVPIAHVGQTQVEGVSLAPGQRQFQIDFFGLAFGMGEALRYRYMLEGLDRDWSAPMDERTVRYTALPPREYRFLVKAISADGTESARPATVRFTVLPALWQRTWVQALAVIAIILIATIAYRIRVGRLLALERVRSRIASDLHDDVGATLAQIAVLSEVVQTQIDDPHAPLRGPLARIAQTSRDAIASMSDIVWAINPQKDSLRATVFRMREFAGDVLTPRGLTFTLDEPAQDATLTADLRRQIYLIFKEAVNNVLRHAEATHVDIDLRVDTRRRLRLRITDNGRGFDPAACADEGNGLGSMQRRAQALGGTLTITSRPGESTIEADVPYARFAPVSR
jgi:signal transduction histidine kinase/ligand-binding sensor domain-containing protein